MPHIMCSGYQVSVSQQLVNKCGLLKSMYEDCGGQLLLPSDDRVSFDLIQAIDSYAITGTWPDYVDLRLLANLAFFLDYSELMLAVKQRIKLYLQDKSVEYQYWWQTGKPLPDSDHQTLHSRNKEIFVKYYAPFDSDNIVMLAE